MFVIHFSQKLKKDRQGFSLNTQGQSQVHDFLSQLTLVFVGEACVSHELGTHAIHTRWLCLSCILGLKKTRFLNWLSLFHIIRDSLDTEDNFNLFCYSLKAFSNTLKHTHSSYLYNRKPQSSNPSPTTLSQPHIHKLTHTHPSGRPTSCGCDDSFLSPSNSVPLLLNVTHTRAFDLCVYVWDWKRDALH